MDTICYDSRLHVIIRITQFCVSIIHQSLHGLTVLIQHHGQNRMIIIIIPYANDFLKCTMSLPCVLLIQANHGPVRQSTNMPRLSDFLARRHGLARPGSARGRSDILSNLPVCQDYHFFATAYCRHRSVRFFM